MPTRLISIVFVVSFVTALPGAVIRGIEKSDTETKEGKEESCCELAEIAKIVASQELRAVSLKKPTVQAILTQIAMADRSWDVRRAAVEKLANPALAEIAKTASETTKMDKDESSLAKTDALVPTPGAPLAVDQAGSGQTQTASFAPASHGQPSPRIRVFVTGTPVDSVRDLKEGYRGQPAGSR